MFQMSLTGDNISLTTTPADSKVTSFLKTNKYQKIHDLYIQSIV